MSTFFRFALQTTDHRFSETWSFFGSKREECIFATRTSMKDWLKVSFHQSGACHLKTYSPKSGSCGEKKYEWKYPGITENASTHIMRVVYDVEKQAAKFPFSDKVKIIFEEIKGIGSIYFDVFLTLSKSEIDLTEDRVIVASHSLNEQKWVYFTLSTGPSVPVLPQGISGLIFHLGDRENKDNDTDATVINSTGLWYVVPESSGTFSVFEASFSRL